MNMFYKICKSITDAWWFITGLSIYCILIDAINTGTFMCNLYTSHILVWYFLMFTNNIFSAYIGTLTFLGFSDRLTLKNGTRV